MNKKLTIYFDMDGVLANFDEAVMEMRHLDENPWINIPNFLRNLQPIGNPDATIKKLQDMGYTVYILTKVEVRDTMARAIDKAMWVNKHLPSFNIDNLIIVPGHESKLKYIKSKIEHSLLLDDYKGNLIEWKNAGGLAVKFGYKYKEERPYFQITQSIENLISVAEKLEVYVNG